MPAVFSSLAGSSVVERVRALLLSLPGNTPEFVETCITAALAHEGHFNTRYTEGLDEMMKEFPDGPLPLQTHLSTNQIGEMACAIANKENTVPPLRFLLTVAKACAPVPASEASASAGGEPSLTASEASASAGGEPSLTAFERDLQVHLKVDLQEHPSWRNNGAQFLRGNEYGHMWQLFFGPIMRLAGDLLSGESGDIIHAYFTLVAGIHFVNQTTAAGWHSCTDPLRMVRIDSLAATLATEIGYKLKLLGKRPAGKPATTGPPRTQNRKPQPHTLAAAAGMHPATEDASHAPKPPKGGAGKAGPSPMGTPEEQAKKANERSWVETRRTDAAIVAELGAKPLRIKPCKFFPLGTCSKGDACTFSHEPAAVAAGKKA